MLEAHNGLVDVNLRVTHQYGGSLVCSEKLTMENWKPIKHGDMLIVSPGAKMKDAKKIYEPGGNPKPIG